MVDGPAKDQPPAPPDRSDDIDEVERKLDNAVEYLYSKIENLTSQFGDLESKIRDVGGDVGTLKGSVETLSQDVGTIKEESEGVKTDLDHLQGRFQALESGTATLKSKVETLEKGNYDSRLTVVENSVQKIPGLDDKTGKLTVRVEELEKKVDGKIKELEAESDEWKGNFDEFWTKHKNVKEDSAKELDKVKGEWDTDKETYEQRIARITQEAKTTEEGLHSEIRNRDEKLNESQTTINDLTSSLKTTTTESEMWQKKYHELENKYMKDKVVQ